MNLRHITCHLCAARYQPEKLYPTDGQWCGAFMISLLWVWKYVINIVRYMTYESSLQVFCSNYHIHLYCASWLDSWKFASSNLFKFMMTSSNGDIFRVTDHLCGKFTAQRPVTRSFNVFFDLNKRLSKQSWGWGFETLPCPLWRHCNLMYLPVMCLHHEWQTVRHFDFWCNFSRKEQINTWVNFEYFFEPDF